MSSNDQKPVYFEDQIEDKPSDKPYDEVKVPLPVITGGMRPSQVKLRSIQFIVCIPVFFFLFTSALCVLQFFTTRSSNVEEFNAIIAVLANIIDVNCLEAPVTSLKVITSDSLDCPPDYSFISIGAFLGTEEGCFVSNTGHIDSGSCSPGAGGVSVAPITAAGLKNWRNYSLCAKRSLTITHVDQSSNCPKDSKICKYSPGFICVGEKEPCPISDLRIWHNEIPVPSKYITEPLGSSFKLTYTNDPNVPRRLTGFDISLNGLLCLDFTEAPPRFYQSSSYPLMKRVEDGCKDFGMDFDAQVIDSYSEEDFYTGNYAAVLNLPRMREYSRGNNITLNARYTMSVKNSPSCFICRDDTEEGLLSIQQMLRQTRHSYLIFSKYGLILAAVMIVTTCFNIYSYCALKRNIVNTFLRVIKINWCVFSYMMGHFLTAGIFAIKDFMGISSTIQGLDAFVEEKCFTNNNVNQVLEELHRGVLPTTLKMTINSGAIFAAGIVSSTLVILASYVLSGIKRIKNTQDEAKPLSSLEIELQKNQSSEDVPKPSNQSKDESQEDVEEQKHQE